MKGCNRLVENKINHNGNYGKNILWTKTHTYCVKNWSLKIFVILKNIDELKIYLSCLKYLLSKSFFYCL